jgi:hypothetical protein
VRGRPALSVLKVVLMAALVGGLLLGTVGMAGGAGSAVPVCHPGRQVVCIDRTDGGHSVPVKVGQTVTVDLDGSSLRWSDLHQVGPSLLRQRRAMVVRRGTLTASYVAKGVGRTGLRATGAPQCAHGKACPLFIVLWQVNVVIAGGS